MALPKAVQRQVEEADRLAGQLSGDEPGNTETGTNNEPSDLQDSEIGGLNDPPNDPPADDKTVLEEPKPNQVPEETWERKYHVLQGKFDAEVPRLHQQMREMQTQMQQLITEKAVLEATKAAEPAPVNSSITEQDKEAFGPDLIDLIERATEAKVSTLRAKEADLVNEIKELKGKLGDVSERQVVSDKDRFLAGLGQQVPDWEALNVNQGFLEWLNQVDPVYGLPRQTALNNAYENLDVTRVANIFKAYKALLPQAPQQSKANQELQRQVAPTRTRSATAPTDSVNQKIFTQQEIATFYDEWRRGHYDEEEAARMEKDIHAAITEGRIR